MLVGLLLLTLKVAPLIVLKYLLFGVFSVCCLAYMLNVVIGLASEQSCKSFTGDSHQQS